MQTISLLATLLVVAAFGAASVNADKKSVQEKRQDKMATRLSICERKSKVVNNKIATLKDNIKTALGDADAAMAVDCVETGNAVTDCTADCAVAVATVTTAPFGIGAACKGDHACVAGEGLCPADVNCVESATSANDCLADCVDLVAIVTTAQSGKGSACAGNNYTCNAGDGLCPPAALCVKSLEKNCAADKMVTTQQECELCAEYLKRDSTSVAWWSSFVDDIADTSTYLPGCAATSEDNVYFNVHAKAVGYPRWNSYALCKG